MFDFAEMDVQALETRRAQIAELCSADDADLDALEEEVRAINAELENRKAAEAKRAEIRKAVAAGDGKTVEKIESVEERKTMTDKEIRSSKAYVDAYVDYIKGKTDGTECRKLLTENVEPTNMQESDSTVPVPTYIEERIQASWENDEIMRRVFKSYIKGNLKVGVEISATGAVLHKEGGAYIDEEELKIAMVDIIPGTLKKYITFSSEVMDMRGEEFLNYLYDEFTYQIVKAAAGEVYDTISNRIQEPSGPQVPQLEVTELGLADIVNMQALLSPDSTDLVFIAHPTTIAQYRALALAANFAFDPFANITVIPSNKVLPYGAGRTLALLGDLKSIRANFPNGEDIKFIFDETSMAELDLVKLVGRMYVGFGYIRNNGFVSLYRKVS